MTDDEEKKPPSSVTGLEGYGNWGARTEIALNRSQNRRNFLKNAGKTVVVAGVAGVGVAAEIANLAGIFDPNKSRTLEPIQNLTQAEMIDRGLTKELFRKVIGENIKYDPGSDFAKRLTAWQPSDEGYREEPWNDTRAGVPKTAPKNGTRHRFFLRDAQGFGTDLSLDVYRAQGSLLIAQEDLEFFTNTNRDIAVNTTNIKFPVNDKLKTVAILSDILVDCPPDKEWYPKSLPNTLFADRVRGTEITYFSVNDLGKVIITGNNRK